MFLWTALLADHQGAFAQALALSPPDGMRDFVEYWAASRLLVHGGNPYSPVELLPLQQAAGWSGAAPLLMWNPPWTFLFTLPFGLLNVVIGQFLWLVAQVILILFSARQLWAIYSESAPSYRMSWVLAFSFVPTVFALIIGQITPLILAGVSLFLYSEKEQRPWIMSFALVILSIKPHLLYLFWMVAALWVFQKHQRRVISGVAVMGAVAALMPLLFDPRIYSQYLVLYQNSQVLRPMDWAAPTLRNVMKMFLHVDQPWAQFSPTIIGISWALYYWQRHRHEWIWRERLPLIILISVASSFFVWTYELRRNSSSARRRCDLASTESHSVASFVVGVGLSRHQHSTSSSEVLACGRVVVFLVGAGSVSKLPSLVLGETAESEYDNSRQACARIRLCSPANFAREAMG